MSAPPLSSISTYYGGLEARNIEAETINPKPGDVLIIRKEEEEQVAVPAQPPSLPLLPPKIDVRSASPLAQSRRLVEKRSGQVRSQYEKIVTTASTSREDEESGDEKEIMILRGDDGNNEDNEDNENNVDRDGHDSIDEHNNQSAGRPHKSESSAATNSNATSSDSMERFERPSKLEMQQLQQEKKQQKQMPGASQLNVIQVKVRKFST